MCGFERDIKEMEESAAAGCHCCAIFLANTDPLNSQQGELGLGNKNRVFVVFNEELLSLCFLYGLYAQTPLQFVLKTAKCK